MSFAFIYRSFFRIFISLLMLMLSVGGGAMCQRYQTMSYTEADGLANSMVFDIVQDSSGILWIARRLGISSYDGTEFTNYSPADGLRSGSYSFLAIDEKENLWALPESGTLFFSCLKGVKWQTFFRNKPVPDDFRATYTSFDVVYDKGAVVVMAGTRDKGFVLYTGNQWKIFNIANGLPDDTVNSVRGFEGKIYIATAKGLTILGDGVLKPFQKNGPNVLPGCIRTMERDGKLLWLLGDSWLGCLSEGNFTLVAEGFHLPVHGLGRNCFLHAGRNGKIYFGNSFKVFSYDRALKSLEKLDRDNGLISEGGSSALVDREMNTWISGYRGITKIPSERFASFSEKERLFSNEVASAIEESPGHYVFGHDAALTFYDGKVMTHLVLYPVRMETNYETRVLDIQKDLKGNLWLAVSSLGVARIDKNKRITWYREKQGLTGVANTVAITPSGNLYAGTSDGLFGFINGRFRQLDLGRIYNQNIRKIISGADSTIYMATLNSGVLVMKGKELISCTSADNPLANNVYAIFTDSQQRKWVGTAAGLYELSGHILKRVDHDGLMINRPVYLVIEDHIHNLWIGTDNGVYRWNGKSLDHFTVTDGLAGQDINRAAGFTDSKNHVWFGTNNGITVFKPELDYKQGQVPPPRVTLLPVIVGNSSIDPLLGKKLPFDLNDLSFGARVISLINEKKIRVKYYLEGFDKDWSVELPYTGSPFVYNNLNPGSYRFFLKAQNSIGIWSSPVVSATFTIMPPFWLRWWFMAIELLLFSGMVYLTTRFILVNRYKNHLKKEVQLRTLDLRTSETQLMQSNAAKDTFFSIIAHDLRSPFNAILGFLDLMTSEDADFSEAEQKQILLQLKSTSQQTINLLENLLTWARAQRGSLPFEPENISMNDVIDSNIALFETSAKKKDIALRWLVKEDFVVFADRNMISAIIRNLISNALKFTFPGGTVTIGMELEDPETICVFVKDNGMGIQPSAMENLFKIEKRISIKGTASETGTGLGLILCKEFVEKNGGAIRVTSSVENGSAFFFTLPYSSLNK